MSPLEWIFGVAGLVLQSMVLSTMLWGSLRRYPFIFAYLVVSFLSTIGQFSLKHYAGATSHQFAVVYWACDFLETVLILMIIIHLIRAAMEHHPRRNGVYFGLMLGMVLTGAISVFLVHTRGPGFNHIQWMTEAGRDYYFIAVILNAVLWSTLMRTNNENKQIYLLTSGLGLQLTGAAIAHALRINHPSPAVMFLANWVLLLGTYMLNLYVWYVALKRLPMDVPAGAEETDKMSHGHVEPTSLHH
jgi:hypothetical protein